MSGVHFTEILLLAVIALIVLGPERLPAVARTLGKLSRQARNAWQGVQSELQAELDLDHNRKIMQAASADHDEPAKTEASSQLAQSTAESGAASDKESNEPQQ
ncbi:MAG: Sec-independent protein translocase protein TatB [Pseudomonadota bacterium]